MRCAFIRTLAELAEKDERIWLLTGDLGYMTVEPFSERFPKRFINAGVAEQNMMGVATGLAEAGFMPFVYSIVTFASLRPYEFIRNGPILHRLPVRIVAVGGGFEYGNNGATHFGLEDIGVMRAQPGISIFAPGDHEQAQTVLDSTWNTEGPVYYRLGKDDKATIPGLNGRFEPGLVQSVREGKDAVFIAMGNVAAEAVAAAEQLAKEGISCAVLVVAAIQPAPVEDLAKHLSRFPLALTLEAHYESGGIGSLVSEVVAAKAIPCRVVRNAVKKTPIGVVGSQNYLYEFFGLSREALAKTALRELRGAA